ncbi:hypothetical protein [Lichenifustis flavocetrariae]|uniref:Uncharacterized protein n=1 Tax=Lichenifustis flavocetrariae TaxID=2949735 RepID=A0AA41Z1B8_9HYPH|nr:hypothetical protein [Lichenifustis flavocetrariae]MCW6512411.1 hypothetical protein [Lichenifustis flavocetrariae]
MKIRLIVASMLSICLIAAQVQASPASRPEFWSALDRNGTLSAGWVQVLPILASACNLRLDSRELNQKLFDLSLDDGNESYTAHLYTTLYRIEQHRATNQFVQAWTTMFNGKQKEACETAEALWGNSGRQFAGILKRDAQVDITGTIPSKPAVSCQ